MADAVDARRKNKTIQTKIEPQRHSNAGQAGSGVRKPGFVLGFANY